MIWIILYLALSLLNPIPKTIEVRITGQGVCTPYMRYATETVDFKEYVKGVLPSEWYSTWGEESLKAGAVAVKMYAWATYESKGYVWDCTYDQVYKPWLRFDSTDKAVDDTWDWILINEDGIVTTYYNADRQGCATQREPCMSQWWISKQDNSWMWMINQNYDGWLVKPLTK